MLHVDYIDNFGRLLARVYVDRPDDQGGPVEVFQAMLTAKLAVPYEGRAAMMEKGKTPGFIAPASSPSLGMDGR